MNKKVRITGISVLVGAIMLVITAVTGMANTSGYDTLKSAVKNTRNIKSVTANYTISVKDNGSTIIDSSTTGKMNKENKQSSQTTVIKSGDQVKTVNKYMQDGKLIIKHSESDQYNVMTGSRGRIHGAGKNGDTPQSEDRVSGFENVIDAATKDIQNYISSSSEYDGSKNVTFKMTDSQVPAVANAVAALAVKNTDREGRQAAGKTNLFGSGIKDKLPKLVDNIKISSIDMNSKINKDNLFESKTAKIIITGNDESGNAHEIVVSINANFTDYNNTTPDTVGLNGKQVNTIEAKDMSGFRGRK